MVAAGIVPPLPLDPGGRVSLTLDPARHAELTVRIEPAAPGGRPAPEPTEAVEKLFDVVVQADGGYTVTVYTP